jgi:uracil-DNA glycosylase
MATFEQELEDVRRCTICASSLPLGPRPVYQLHQNARILIAGQAPGRKVHVSGVPFDDASGDRLRSWLGLTSVEFYDPTKIAILPMGFCYPGTGNSGDLPPRPECAVQWRKTLLSRLSNLQLTVVIGQYALDYHLPNAPKSVTDAVLGWRDHLPNALPLPHPSPRNNIWLKKNPWFELEVLPVLKDRVKSVLQN